MLPAMPIALAIGALKVKEVTMLRSLASSLKVPNRALSLSATGGSEACPSEND